MTRMALTYVYDLGFLKSTFCLAGVGANLT